MNDTERAEVNRLLRDLSGKKLLDFLDYLYSLKNEQKEHPKRGAENT